MQGDHMTPSTTKTPSINNALGAALLVFGALLSYMRFEAVAQQISRLLTGYGSEALGLLPATGLAAARLIQNFVFDAAATPSVILQFLLSFWPVGAIFVGAILLCKPFSPQFMTQLTANEESRFRQVPR
jgi:hypothetical protein